MGIKKTLLTQEEILSIYKDIPTGHYSREAAHDELDGIMEQLIGEKEFTGESYALKTRHIQILIGVLTALERRLEQRNSFKSLLGER